MNATGIAMRLPKARAGAGRGRRFAARPPRREGQVLIVAIICMTLLVGLIFYVYNLGTDVNRRMSLQHAADSAAVSGAGWMARSMNTIAMNNCETSRLLAMVPIFDSLPLAVGLSHHETESWTMRLTDQIDRSIPETPGNYSLLISGLRSLRDRMQRQVDILTPLDTALNRSNFDMKSTTWWQPPSGADRGELWKSMLALDSYSRTTAQMAGVLAQEEAVTFALQNRAEVSFLVPVLPTLSAVRTQFADWRPTLEGLERVTGSDATMQVSGGRGGAIPDMAYPHRLGPWARLWRWRDYFLRATEWAWTPPTAGGFGQTRGSHGNVNLPGRRTGSTARGSGNNWGVDGHWNATAWELAGYTTYGPYHWAMRRINWHELGNYWNPGELRDTYFYDYMNRLSRIKLNYMFSNRATQFIHEPNWVVDYDRALQIGLARIPPVTRTMFYLVEVASSVPEDSPNWLQPGTYRTNGPNPIAIWARGWVNTEDPNRWGIPKIGDYVWKDQYWYETTQDTQIGIRYQRDPATGGPLWQKVYMSAWYIWGGIDIGGTIPIENPCNWSSEMDLPAPWLLDTSSGDYVGDPVTGASDPDAGLRRTSFSVLAVARSSQGAPAWPAKFQRATSDLPTAVAQVKIINNKSFDLWTQDWQVQLTPVSQWTDWVDRMDSGAGDAEATRGYVSPQDVRDAAKYLRRFRDMADVYVNH